LPRQLARWGSAPHIELIVGSIQRLAERPRMEDGEFWPAWRSLQKYAAALVLYGVGVAAMFARRYDLLASILTTVRIRESLGEKARLAVLELALRQVFESAVGQELRPGDQKWKTPESDHVHQILREPLRELIPSDDEYDLTFDRFEAFLGLVFTDVYGRGWGPVGRFAWRGGQFGTSTSPALNSLIEEAESEGDNWGPYAAGLFASSKERFDGAVRVIDEVARKLSWR
jgi:hypothetical protein